MPTHKNTDKSVMLWLDITRLPSENSSISFVRLRTNTSRVPGRTYPLCAFYRRPATSIFSYRVMGNTEGSNARLRALKTQQVDRAPFKKRRVRHLSCFTPTDCKEPALTLPTRSGRWRAVPRPAGILRVRSPAPSGGKGGASALQASGDASGPRPPTTSLRADAGGAT